MNSIFDFDIINQMEQNAKKSTKPVEDTSVNQLPDDITDQEINKLIDQMKQR